MKENSRAPEYPLERRSRDIDAQPTGQALIWTADAEWKVSGLVTGLAAA